MSLLGELAGAVKGVVKGAISATPLGGVAMSIYNATKGGGGPKRIPIKAQPPAQSFTGGPPMLPALAGIAAGASRILPAIVPRIGSLIPAAGTAARVAVTGARQVWGKLPRWSKEAAIAAGFTIAGTMVLDSSGNPVGRVGGRRMNPMNAKAARRAIRRIKSVRKILTSIEKSLPRARRR